MEQLEVKDLGELKPCSKCSKPTYVSKSKNQLLPEGFTVGNERQYVWIHGMKLLVCTTCRYDVCGAF